MINRLKHTFREDSCYRVFFASLIITGLGYGLYKGVLDNYLAEIVTMTEFDRGAAEFFRELPGLMLVFILAVFYMHSAGRLYKAGAVIMHLPGADRICRLLRELYSGFGHFPCIHGVQCLCAGYFGQR